MSYELWPGFRCHHCKHAWLTHMVAREQQRGNRLRNERVPAALDSCVTSQVDTVLILTLLLLTFTGMVRLHQWQRSPRPLTH